MSIKTYSETPQTVEFEGTIIGIRHPKVGEMKIISRMREKYIKSMRDKDGNVTPPLEQMNDVEFYIGSTMACDPERANNPWFAASDTEQRELKTKGFDKDLATEVPYQMLKKIHDAFVKHYEQVQEATEKDNPTGTTSVNKETAVVEPSPAIPEENTSPSVASSLESPSISE